MLAGAARAARPFLRALGQQAIEFTLFPPQFCRQSDVRPRVAGNFTNVTQTIGAAMKVKTKVQGGRSRLCE